MAGAKRDPSSFVQLTISTGWRVVIDRSLSVRTSSSAARTPRAPSNLPPVGWLSRCDPIMTGGKLSSAPLRRANIVPIRSTVTVMPAFSHHFWNRVRLSRSRSVKVSLLTPPLGVAPIWAISMRLSHSRSLLILRLRPVLSGVGITGVHCHCCMVAGDLVSGRAGRQPYSVQ